MKSVASAIVCLSSAAALTHGATFEFAVLSFPGGGIRWVDKAGAREVDGKSSSADLFAQLSRQDPQLARSAQYQVLVLNGLSKSGWLVVHISDNAGTQMYLLRRETSGLTEPSP